MKQIYKDYLTEKNVDEKVMAACWMIVEVGEGLPMRLLDHEHYPVIEDAIEQGYLTVDNESRIRLTHKARAFFDTLLALARDEGEIK